MRGSGFTKVLLSAVLVGALVFSAIMLAGCGCSRDKDGDDVKKKSTTETATIVGEWHLTEAIAVNQANTKLDLDEDTKAKTSIIIREDLSATMSFVDGTFLGKVTRTPESDMTYADAWNQYTVEAYTFSTADGSVEIEICFSVRNDNSQKPFILMYDSGVNYYYNK